MNEKSLTHVITWVHVNYKMSMISKPYAIVCLSMLVLGSLVAAEMKSVRDLSPDQIGEFVTLKGASIRAFPPRDAKSPYAFIMEDNQGTEIRVVSWPDIFENVKNRDLLATTGSQILITAEVAEYRGKLELRLQDWEELKITPPTTVTLTAKQEYLTSGAVQKTKP